MKPKSKSQAKRFKAMGAPERTPLSERMRWDNCICGKGNPNGIGQSGDDWDLDTQCAYCDDADEVAALEQERVDLLRRNQLLRDRDEEMQMAVDKGIRFEAEVERLQGLVDTITDTAKRRLEEVERLRAAIRERECECLEGKWDARGMVPPHTCWRCRALTTPEGEE